MDYLIGLDIGTSQIKAVLFDAFGNEVVSAAEKTESFSPSIKYMEQDMNELWNGCVRCLSRLMEAAPCQPEEIRAIGLSGQGEGLWLLDEKGQPLQNAILWNDGRAAETVSKLSEEEISVIKKITMSFPLPASTLMQLKWMSDRREDLLRQAKTCVFCKDWIRFKLTGEFYCEETDASVTLLNMKSKDFARDVFTLLGLEQYLDIFPPLLQSSERAGSVTMEASQQTGLPAGIPVAAGALDVAATCLGVHGVKDKDLFLILGTTACSGLVTRPEGVSPEKGKYLLHPKSEYLIKVMATMAGTPNVDWMSELFGLQQDFSQTERILENTPPGSGGVIYHPYISPAGERYPFYHPSAKAGFFGLSAGTGRDQLIRSVFEGVALSVKDSLEDEASSEYIHIAGGGSNSNQWCQIIADCCQRQVVRYRGGEFGAKGAAMLAGVCAGWYEDLDTMSDAFCQVEQIFSPEPEAVAIYDSLFSIYKALRLAQVDLWHLHQNTLNDHSL